MVYYDNRDMIIRSADIVLTGAADVLRGPVDILVRDGRIHEMGQDIAPPSGCQVIEARGRLVAPGLVNAHWHSPMQLSHGTSDRTNHKVFMWENQVDTANRSADEIRVSALIGCLQMLKTGTSAVIDHFPEQGFGMDDVASVVGALAESGMRAVVALRIFDGDYADILPPPEARAPQLVEALRKGNTLAPRPLGESMALVEEAITRFDGEAGRIRVFPAPSNPVRCSDDMLLACQDLAEQHDTGVHCHMLETRTQVALAAARYGRTMIEHMDAIGAFSGRWSNAHCNWVSEREMEIMAARGAVAVLNPESNLKIGSGVPPVPHLLGAGVTCALGTDGASTNDNLVLQDAMSLAAMLHRPDQAERRDWVGVSDVVAMATTGGARAMLEPDLGRIAPGAKADLVLYDLDQPHWVPVNDVEQQLVFGERGSGVDTVIVGGRVVLAGGRSTLIDEAEIVREARAMLASIRKRNGAVRAVADAVAAVE